MIPFFSHADSLMLNTRRMGNILHWDAHVLQISPFVHDAECFGFVNILAGERPGELQAGYNEGAVQATVKHGGRICVDVVGMPPPPQGGLPVIIDKIIIVFDDVRHYGVDVIGDAFFFLCVFRRKAINNGCNENIGHKLVAACRTFPQPIRVGRLPPSVGVVHNISFALKRSSRKAFHLMYAEIPLKSLERFPYIAFGGLLACNGITECLTSEVKGSPKSVIVVVFHTNRGRVAGFQQS